MTVPWWTLLILRDAFFGVGVMFNEDSLKPLFSSLPLASAAGPSN